MSCYDDNPLTSQQEWDEDCREGRGHLKRHLPAGIREFCAKCKRPPGFDESELKQRYPWIEWDEPILVNGRFGCRYCIAQKGLNGRDVPRLPNSLKDFQEHLKEVHGIDHDKPSAEESNDAKAD